MLTPDFYAQIPVEYHAIKKNNRPIHGRGQRKWLGKSPRLKKAELDLILILRKLWGHKSPLKGDIWAIFRFYTTGYFTAKNVRNRQMFDLSNAIELPQDCLQTAGVIENDTDIVSLDGSGRFPGTKNILEIELYVLHGGIYERRTGNLECPRCHRFTGP